MLGVAAILVAGAAVAYMLLPVIQGEFAPMERSTEEPDEDRARRRVVLRAIRDAEYDFETGKLDAPDYQALKAELTQEAFELLDAADPDSDPAPQRAQPTSARGDCPSCGAVNRTDSRFCSDCGASLGSMRNRPTSSPSQPPAR